MPWQKPDIVAQGKQFLANGVDQLLVVAARKVCTADGAPEDHIPHDGKMEFWMVKNDMAPGMPRTMIDSEGLLADGNRIAFL